MQVTVKFYAVSSKTLRSNVTRMSRKSNESKLYTKQLKVKKNEEYKETAENIR